MTSEEYGLWMAEYARNPWGPERADLGPAIVAATLANAHRQPGAPAFTPGQFMPYAQQQTKEEQSDYDKAAEMLRGLTRG